MGRARLGGAGVVLVARDQPGNDGLQRVGFGCGEGFQRFKRRRRGRVPLCSALLRHGRARRERCPGKSCRTRGPNVLEHIAP
jgi:hypothetical protein